MENRIRAHIFAFLSRIYGGEIDAILLDDLLGNTELLETIGEEASAYLKGGERDSLLEALNIEYNTLFLMNNHPVESILHYAKGGTLTGLQNPVVQFYFDQGYEIDMSGSALLAPDHISVEFAFMQQLVPGDEKEIELRFYREHLLTWIPQFLIAIRDMTNNPFYRDLCDFTVDFLLEDFGNLS